MASFNFDTWCMTTKLTETSVDTLKTEDLHTEEALKLLTPTDLEKLGLSIRLLRVLELALKKLRQDLLRLHPQPLVPSLLSASKSRPCLSRPSSQSWSVRCTWERFPARLPRSRGLGNRTSLPSHMNTSKVVQGKRWWGKIDLGNRAHMKRHCHLFVMWLWMTKKKTHLHRRNR